MEAAVDVADVQRVQLSTWAALNGVSGRTASRYLKLDRDPLPHYRIGTTVLIDVAEADEWLRRRRHVGA